MLLRVRQYVSSQNLFSAGASPRFKSSQGSGYILSLAPPVPAEDCFGTIESRRVPVPQRGVGIIPMRPESGPGPPYLISKKKVKMGSMALDRSCSQPRPAASQVDAASEERGAAGGPQLEDVKEEVLLNEDLMKQVFSHLCLEDLCKAGMARPCWRDITNNPTFWRVIDLEGKSLTVQKVCHLLTKHCGVYVLKARKVRFQLGDLPSMLPKLTSLRSLELEKPAYDEHELESLSVLTQLTRLVLAGGFVGSGHPAPVHAWGPPLQAQELASLSSPSLQHLVLENGRTGRLAIRAPRLVSLKVKEFMWGQLQLQGATNLAALSVLDCGKLADSALRNLLYLEGQQVQQLPAFSTLHISNATHLSDETLRLAGQRHPNITSLHVEGCAAVTGANLAPNGAFQALQSLWLEGCDLIYGASLAASVQSMQSLESLTIMFCPQVSVLSLQCSHLTRLCLQGNRGLSELSLRCPRLAQVDLSPPSPGMASAHVLRRISLASYAVESLQWAAFPALEEVKLQCANLAELDLSECSLLRDSVFESLGPGQGMPSFAGADGISPGCPRLRFLKLTDCDALRKAVLSSPSIESLQLSHCLRLEMVDLNCSSLHRLGLEECTQLESVNLLTQRMTGMSLGTCPRLESISIESPSMDMLDLRGCNSLQRLRLDCPALRKIDATFCSSLPNAAMPAVARCPALEDLTLAVCNSLTAEGLTALAALQSLQSLDLSYMPIEDPRPIYSACLQLTSLTISNNYLINPSHLRDLLPPPLEEGGEAGSSALVRVPGHAGDGKYSGPLHSLVSLDVSYCMVPSDVLEDMIVRGGRQLEQLTISGCSGVTDDLILRLHHRSSRTGRGSAHALKLLSMVGSKALRHVYLGLMPEQMARAQGCEPKPRRHAVAEAAGCSAAASNEGAAAEEHVGVETVLPALEELRIGLTGVRTVAIGLPSLTRLQLFNCSELRQLTMDCPKLEKLSVQACKRLPLEDLLAVLHCGCPSLLELDVQYYTGVDGSMVPLLQQACPTLQHVYITVPQRS